ncbi:MAG TPA: hypothetical protein VGX25_06735 [Actinophytocola sp.]|uniref:DUF7341 domain-containing protein n=1 Tax=Actinophytocola sp. TaxID=1872138 RepID=UPI002DDCB6C4|nr:hypothetical protein [Actinophytocola sp.]HEV2779084.1 hypothetical protein [Actinophytocola sp.]
MTDQRAVQKAKDLADERAALTKVVAALVDPVMLRQNRRGPLRERPSLLEQLAEEVASSGGRASGRGRGSPAPIAPAAHDLLEEIRATARDLWRTEAAVMCGRTVVQAPRVLDDMPVPERIRRGARYVSSAGREVRDIAWLTNLIGGWVEKINELINPEMAMEVLAPCPACGRRWVYVEDAGEQKRVAAVVAGPNGARCRNLACGHEWRGASGMESMAADIRAGLGVSGDQFGQQTG